MRCARKYTSKNHMIPKLFKSWLAHRDLSFPFYSVNVVRDLNHNRNTPSNIPNNARAYVFYYSNQKILILCTSTSFKVTKMDKGKFSGGIFFIFLGVFAALLPYLGLLSPGEVLDPRFPYAAVGIGVLFLIMGLTSNSEELPTPQPVTSQPPQQMIKTLVVCPKCGNRTSVESKYCPECATSLMPKKQD